MNNITKIINDIESLQISDEDKSIVIQDIKKMTENVVYAMWVDFDIFATDLRDLFTFSQSEIEDPTIYVRISDLLYDYDYDDEEENPYYSDYTSEQKKIVDNCQGIVDATIEVVTKAYELNEGWTPDWGDDNQAKYFIHINSNNEFVIMCYYVMQLSTIYFKDIETAQKLIDSIDTETLVRYLTHNI